MAYAYIDVYFIQIVILGENIGVEKTQTWISERQSRIIASQIIYNAVLIIRLNESLEFVIVI